MQNADIIDAVGEAVTQHTPTLENISGELLSDALTKWAPRLPRLQSLELWDGKPLEDELVHASLYEHCPNFNSLMIYTWISEDSDHKFAKFLSSMRPNSLTSLQTLSNIRAGAETYLALNHHGKSLEELRLTCSNDSAAQLSLLQGCTALKTLRIDDLHVSIDLEATQHDVFLELIAWLRKCESLQHLSFFNFLSGVAIMTPVLLEHNIRLISLEIDSYTLKDHKTFHQALVHQQASLRNLSLSGDTEGMYRDDLDVLVDSLKQLHELRDLKLILPEILRDEHLVTIIGSLTLLEDLYVSGLELNDVVLGSLAKLPNLRNVTLSGISKFTMDGLLEFVSQLGPGNQNIRVTVDMADPESLLSDEVLSMVRDCLFEKTGGSLEYMAFRGMHFKAVSHL